MTVNAARKIIQETKVWMLICFAQKLEHEKEWRLQGKPLRKRNVPQFLYFESTHRFHWQATPKLQM
jgi:exoribonuclease R